MKSASGFLVLAVWHSPWNPTLVALWPQLTSSSPFPAQGGHDGHNETAGERGTELRLAPHSLPHSLCSVVPGPW